MLQTVAFSSRIAIHFSVAFPSTLYYLFAGGFTFSLPSGARICWLVIILCGPSCVYACQPILPYPLGGQHVRVSRRHLTRDKRSRREKFISKQNEKRKQLPQTTTMNKSGSSTTDLRNLPAKPPLKKERPKRPDPKIIRKVYRKPAVTPDS